MNYLIFIFALLFGFLEARNIDDLRELHQMGEGAMQEANYPLACRCFKEILKKGTKEDGDPYTYADVHLRLATAQFHLRQWADAKQTLKQLRKEYAPLPLDLWMEEELLRAQIQNAQNHPGRAYYLLKNLSRTIPLSQWKPETKAFFQGLEHLLNTHYDQMLNKAQNLKSHGQSNQAIDLLKEVMQDGVKGYYPRVEGDNPSSLQKIRLNLAECLFEKKEYEKVIEHFYTPLLTSLEKEKLETVETKNLFLLAKSCFAEEHYDKALLFFEGLLAKTPLSSQEEEEAQWKRAYCLLQLKKIDRAKQAWQDLYERKTLPLAPFYLAYIALIEQQYEKIEELFPTFPPSFPDPQYTQAFYLLGESAYQKGDFGKALPLFEKARTKYFYLPSTWQTSLYAHLGECYRQKESLEQALSVLQEALTLYPKEESYRLAMGEIYFTLCTRFNDSGAAHQLESLLSVEPFSSLDNQAHALLLRAKTQPAKEALFEELTTETYAKTKVYAQGWQEKGLYEFTTAKTLWIDDPINSKPVFEKAVTSFQQARSLFQKPSLAAQALRYEVEAHTYASTPEHLKSALQCLETLYKEEGNILAEAKISKEEILYTKGLIAYRLYFNQGKEKYLAQAQHSLSELWQQYPNSDFAIEGLFAIATMQFQRDLFSQAIESFLLLARQHPSSLRAGDSLFWAAECLKVKEEEHKEQRKTLYHRVFTDYPQCTCAPEAYFYYYPFKEYLEGKQEAIAHLQQFEKRYPNTPFCITAFYLLGRDKMQDRKNATGLSLPTTDYQLAATYFEKAHTTFDTLFSQKLIPAERLHYFTHFRYQALLEKALVYLSYEDSSKAIACLEEMTNDFEKTEHPLMQTFYLEEDFPKLYEESLFTLLQAYLKQGEEEKAAQTIDRFLQKYGEASLTKGYYLSRVYYEKGRLKIQQKEYTDALEALQLAEECGTDLSEEQQIDLWILQSECYRSLDCLDEAMLRLSHVINFDAPSTLRLKAMLLRAEIYALQGRFELAIKQLEAIVQKGGEWGQKAKEKLKGYRVSS